MMDEQELEAALSLLVSEMEDEVTDRHEIFLRLTAILNGMQAMGMPLPEDLVRLQDELAADFADESGAPAEPDEPERPAEA